MSKLPASWVLTSIGEVTLDIVQRGPEPSEKFKYIDISSIDRETKRIASPQALIGKDAPSRARKEVKAGDVLVSMTRPNLNAVAQVPEELEGQIASTGFDVLRPTMIDPKWLFYIVRTDAFIEQMTSLVQGALYPAIRSKDVRGYVIPLAPLNEQKRITDKLDTLLLRVDSCRERLERVPLILKRFRQAVLSAATSGQLTEDWRKSQSLEDWNTVSVEDVATEVFDGPFGSHLKSKDYSHAGKRVIRLENIGWLKFVADKETFIPQAKFEALRKHTLMACDILFSSFIAEEVRVCLLPDDLSGNAINKADCFCVRVDSKICLPKFLSFRLACRSTFLALEKEVHGATRPRINLSQLKQFTFEMPPVVEQHEIIRRVEALFSYADRFELNYNNAYATVERLTPVLLAKAFRGELMPQDPTDEPAAKLLERIHATQVIAARKPKRERKQNSKRIAEVIVFDLSQIQSDHLSNILKRDGRQTAKDLWEASQLEIEDFYEQLRAEEAQGLLREVKTDAASYLEAA